MVVLTGVIEYNCIDPDKLSELTVNSIDLAWREAVKGLSQEEIEELSENWESDSPLLYGFRYNAEIEKFEIDPEQPFSCIINQDVGTIQIVRSNYIMVGVYICSPCYPNQVDLESDGDLTGYCLPSDCYKESFKNIQKIKKGF